METASIFSVDFSSPSFFVALAVTALCFVFAPIAVRLKSKSDERGGGSLKKACNCVCSCSDTLEATETVTAEKYLNGVSEGGGGELLEMAPAVVAPAAGERQTGASMMEQLVPEITTHALSYLDYPSLCRLSMTNSLMRKAANDDNAWKALYHKDFTLEQDNISPVNGWKAYYAATRAIVNVNAGFFNIIRERALPAMGRLWLNVDYVKCIHATGELFTGKLILVVDTQKHSKSLYNTLLEILGKCH
ncbi:nuclear transport factor 2 (NTF2) family protein [Actinidia rufa]|uniref:Nuclear transport factor 2 (NTF2) family protein n=1 Tax=Actinidia rufa TaxID=165716 RepID=A0A7J0DJ46_9ERIC|nr:nuclear transport factor 2 (NTF2) family protein [Actinidia rufa]